MTKLLLLVCALPLVSVAAAEQTLAQYLQLPPDATARAMTVDVAGNIFVAADVIEPSGRGQARLIKVDPRGNTLASIDLRETGSSISALALDPAGNVVVLGVDQLTIPHVSLPSPEGFLVKVDAGLTKVLSSAKIGGTKGSGTIPNAVAVDGAGNIYVAGETSDTDFPVTSGAFQTSPPPNSLENYAFLAEFGPDGQHLIFSTYFGDSSTNCMGGSACLFVSGQTNATAIAVDAAGNITIAGNTTAAHLPVTAGVYAAQCSCTNLNGAGFLARFAPGGTSLLWATYFPVVGGPGQESVKLNGLALDPSGNAVFGGEAPGGLPVSANALQPGFFSSGSSAGFVAKLDSLGQHLLFSTYLGGGSLSVHPPAAVTALAIDRQGLIRVTGVSDPGQLPVPAGTPLLGTTFTAALAGDGSSVVSILTAPKGAAGQAIAAVSNGSVVTLGPANSLLVTTAGQGPSLAGIANSAGIRVSNAVAPYELVSLYGTGIGPVMAAGAQVVNGVLSNTLGGVQVLFDGVPAPLLYAGPTQINAIVPSGVAYRDTTTLQIVTPSGTVPGPTLLVRPSAPAVFLDPASLASPAAFPVAVALNQDGSVNSPGNPAARGSIVTVWGTGAGISTNYQPDGSVNGQNLGKPVLPVSVLNTFFGSGAESLEVLYGGDAPGLAQGVIQVNFRLPQAGQDNAYFVLQVGEAKSDVFSVYMQPGQRVF